MHGTVSRRSSPNPEKSNQSVLTAERRRFNSESGTSGSSPSFRLDPAQWWWRGRPSGRAGVRTHAHHRSDAGLTDRIGCDRLRGCAVSFQRRPDATACLAEDLPALCVHLKYVPVCESGSAHRICWSARSKRSVGERRCSVGFQARRVASACAGPCSTSSSAERMDWDSATWSANRLVQWRSLAHREQSINKAA
jgi:hypothetical protein